MKKFLAAGVITATFALSGCADCIYCCCVLLGSGVNTGTSTIQADLSQVPGFTQQKTATGSVSSMAY